MSLRQLLEASLSQDGTLRQQAEATLLCAKQNGAQTLPEIVAEACSGPEVHTRHLAALLLKQWVPETWQQVAEDEQQRCCAQLQARCIAGVRTLWKYVINYRRNVKHGVAWHEHAVRPCASCRESMDAACLRVN